MTREKAIEIATKAHFGQKRKDGKDYITHPIAVAEIAERFFWEKFADEFDGRASEVADKIYIVSVLHDVLEDTSVTLGEIAEHFSDHDVLRAIQSLTRKENQTYYDFIRDIVINGNLISNIVKFSDIKHNMSDLKEGSLKDKYRFAHEKIESNLRFFMAL